MNFKLPTDVEYILSTLEASGYRADIVGGSVRDFLLGKDPGDYDITTSALPEEVKATFAGERIIETGIKHGTVTLVLSGTPYEITTYRFDGEYSDSRHPTSVSFTRRIEDDLMRRDFTVNAMAYSYRHGLTDLYGGIDDISARLIRAVGDPDTRFSEDALRILRAIRFSSVLGFEVEEKTALAAIRNMPLLSNVSAERIYVEWKKLLAGEKAYRTLSDFALIIGQIIPELSSLVLPDPDSFAAGDSICRMLSLFALSAENPASAFDSAADRLRMDNATRHLGVSVLSSLGRFDTSSDKGLTYALMSLGESATRTLIDLETLLHLSAPDAKRCLSELLSRGVAYRLSDLKINGTDLMAIGVRGREIGNLLSKLLCEVVEQRVSNERDALLSFAKTVTEIK